MESSVAYSHSSTSSKTATLSCFLQHLLQNISHLLCFIRSLEGKGHQYRWRLCPILQLTFPEQATPTATALAAERSLFHGHHPGNSNTSTGADIWGSVKMNGLMGFPWPVSLSLFSFMICDLLKMKCCCKHTAVAYGSGWRESYSKPHARKCIKNVNHTSCHTFVCSGGLLGCSLLWHNKSITYICGCLTPYSSH